MGVGNYLRETRSELRHVSWPTRKQAINFTALVIGVSLLVAILLGTLDYMFDFTLREFILDINSTPSATAPANTENGNVQQLPGGATLETIPVTPEETNQ